MRGRGHKKTWKENVEDLEQQRYYVKRRMAEKPLKSPCVEGRLKHQFRSPSTRSLAPDLTCWYCGKTVAQVRAEQTRARMAANMLETLGVLKGKGETEA